MKNSSVTSLRHYLARKSNIARARGAQSEFMFGSAAISDRLIGSLHFAVYARNWAKSAQTGAHLAGYAAGLAQVGSPSSLLDLGTGAGGSAAKAAATFPDARVVGVDISRAMIKQARKRFSAPNLEFLRCNGSHLPFAEGEFEVITMLNALVNPREVARVCAPGGMVMLARSDHAVPPKDGLFSAKWRSVGFDVIDQAAVDLGGWQTLKKRD